MNAKGQHSIVGLIPGGTANVWAGEVGIPTDPVKAALTLVGSEFRKVDIGHVKVQSLMFSDTTSDDRDQQQTTDTKEHTRKVKATPKAKHHFLLMAGLGIDAAIMSDVSKPAKYKIGPLAVGLSAIKKLPEQHAFPVEIHANGKGRNGEVLWQGEALQVIVGNTRRYAEVLQMTPNAYIDDGVLEICVITEGNPLTTTEQILSLLLRRKPDNTTAEYFHGAHLSISVPASVELQLDGSAVKLKDYLSKSDRKALQQAGEAEQVRVNYQFDAMPRALHVAIPSTYNDTLFEDTHGKSESHAEEQAHAEAQQEDSSQHDGKEAEEAHPEIVEALLQDGRTVKVVGVGPGPDKKHTYIIAGGTDKQSNGATQPVAVSISKKTTIVKRNGETATPAVVGELQEGSEIVAEGKKSKRGVIPAKRVVV
jgi:diacylglycerol kinase family enzyme